MFVLKEFLMDEQSIQNDTARGKNEHLVGENNGG